MPVIFADSNRARMRYIRSADGWGTTPTSGKTRELRFNGSTINAQKETVVSDEIRADRMVPGVVEVGAKSTGDVQTEFSAGSHDDFLEGFMFGSWTRPMSFDAVKGDILNIASTSTVQVLGQDVSAYYTAGHRVRLEGFNNAANNDYFQITSCVFDGGNNWTLFTFTTTTMVVEAGGVTAALYDANDVIILKNTAIRAGTAGASTFDSNGGNAFASAIAAGQLVPGQKIFVESALGYSKGKVLYSAQPTAADTVTINDGINPVVTFIYGAAGPGQVPVVIGGSDTVTVTNLVAAINAQRVAGTLNVVATDTDTGLGATLKSLQPHTMTVASPVNTGAVATVTSGSTYDATQRGVFKILTLTSDVLTISPQPATNANAGAVAITIKGSMLRNPAVANAIIPEDFVIETGFEDVSQYFVTDGLKVSSFSLDVSSGAILKSQFGFQGRATTRQGATVLGTAPFTPLATTSTEVVNATVNVGALKINGAALSTALQSVTVTGDNALRDQMAVGDKFPAGIGAGRMTIKGAAKAYFADGSLWDLFINHDTISVEFFIEDGEQHHYEVTVPAAKFSTSSVSPTAMNTDVMEDLEYEAFRDPTTDCQIQFDRFSNVSQTTA